MGATLLVVLVMVATVSWSLLARADDFLASVTGESFDAAVTVPISVSLDDPTLIVVGPDDHDDDHDDDDDDDDDDHPPTPPTPPTPTIPPTPTLPTTTTTTTTTPTTTSPPTTTTTTTTPTTTSPPTTTTTTTTTATTTTSTTPTTTTAPTSTTPPTTAPGTLPPPPTPAPTSTTPPTTDTSPSTSVPETEPPEPDTTEPPIVGQTAITIPFVGSGGDSSGRQAPVLSTETTTIGSFVVSPDAAPTGSEIDLVFEFESLIPGLTTIVVRLGGTQLGDPIDLSGESITTTRTVPNLRPGTYLMQAMAGDVTVASMSFEVTPIAVSSAAGTTISPIWLVLLLGLVGIMTWYVVRTVRGSAGSRMATGRSPLRLPWARSTD